MIKQIWKFYASQSIYFNIFNYNQYQYHPVLDRTELKTKKFFILAVRAFWEIKVNFLFILIKTKNNNRKNKRIGFKSLICKKKKCLSKNLYNCHYFFNWTCIFIPQVCPLLKIEESIIHF
uniref:Uncharacterized protein n=1 Tax=Tricholoma matsutake TaxID=40145 RepID=A0A0U1VTS0_TRIMT|nr:hypothetical protein [Tricholoma matsutake]AGC15261.1 hypothetical protein [Tricholoma matsutake]QIC20169.1 hypothetical protein [Tricholoma matsutake]UIX25467.1 hypothetical protein [Tricholoma matsutake]UIX25495.1 hypothetical protein [Tricholoma matsutake]UIX25523.1 hypothetical protein [Tricholoma matsutake]